MKRSEIAEFIESMEEIGDNWTEEQVEDVYGDMSLKEALADRKASVGRMIDIIGKIMGLSRVCQVFCVSFLEKILWGGEPPPL